MKKAKIAGLPPGVGVTKNSNGSKDYFRVRLGKKFTGGKILTRNFDDLKQAREWIFGDAKKVAAAPGDMVTLKATAGTTSTFALSPKELNEAADAFRRCKNAGMTLTEAVSFAIKHHRPSGGTILIRDAITELIAFKTRMAKRSRYLEKLQTKLRRFARYFPEKTTLNEVNRKKVEAYLTDLNIAPAGEIIEARHVSVLFGWAKKKGYVAENPVTGIEKPEVDKKPPVILTPRAVVNLLRVADELTPWVAVGLFGGFRPEEAQKLEWEDIDFSRRHIDLPAHKAKDRIRRIVPFQGYLEEWLLPYRQTSGLIIPRNYRKRFWAMCSRAGYRALKEGAKGGELQPAMGWPKDVLRHCFGSYHLAKSKSSGATAEMMGHRDAKMLYKHYRDVIKEESDVEAFWEISPEQVLRGDGGNVIEGTFAAA